MHAPCLHESGPPETAVEFDYEKFKEVLHYIISRCGTFSNVGKTVIWKILYFADFDYYELAERPLTGEQYRKLPYGPAPRHFDGAIGELLEEEKILHCDVKAIDYTQHKYIAQTEPELNTLSARELQHLERTIAKYSNMNATQISALSHRDTPWIAADENADIDYELVFYRSAETSVRAYPDD